MVVLDFYGLAGRHLIMDAVISTVYRNTILKTSLIPGNVAKLAEDARISRLMRCRRSMSPASMVRGDHVLVTGYLFPLQWRMVAHWEPMHICALEDSCRACCAVSAGRYSSPDSLIYAGAVALDAALAESSFHLAACY